MALAISLLACAACGSDSRAADAPAIDLSKLETGSYQTQPKDFVPKDAARMARTVEALRLGDAMPLPSEVDPALVHNDGGPRPFVSADDMASPELSGGNSLLGWLSSADFATHAAGFVTGFSTAGRSNDDWNASYQLTDSVMIFDSDTAASSAARALADAGFYRNPASPGDSDDEPVVSTRYPAAQIRWMPHKQALASFYPVGRLLVLAIAHNTENFFLEESDLPGLLALSDKAIQVTTDKLKTFEPTPTDKLTNLPVDADGMLRVTLPRPAGDQTAHAFDGVLHRHGQLHDDDDPVARAALYEKTGVDVVSHGAGFLVRARDAAAATTYADATAADMFQRLIDPPPGLPHARCTTYHGPAKHAFPFTCQAAFGRYVALVWSQQQQDVYQRISAQYAILANDK
ncbi:DUF7373 family lipoprotein [Nocardia heshunensis]